MPIIGNPLALGGGNLLPTDAILRVQAPAGSTVTIVKGTTTKTDEGHENAGDNTVYDYYFIIHASQFDSSNPWTVTATDGASTKTATVIIDTAKEYNIAITYTLYIVEEGVLKETSFTPINGSVTQQNGYTAFSSSGNIGYVAYVPVSRLDRYTTMVLEVIDSNGQAYNSVSNSPSFGIATSIPTVDGHSGVISGYVAYTNLTIVSSDYIKADTYTLDISAFASSANYIVIGVCGTSVFSGSIRVSNFYLAP